MRKLRVGVIDVVAKSASTAWWARVMRANMASIMPQAIGAWCARDGHDVGVAYYSGPQPLAGHLPESQDVVFIGAFTQSAQLAYALSGLCRSKGCRHRPWRAACRQLSRGRAPLFRLRRRRRRRDRC